MKKIATISLINIMVIMMFVACGKSKVERAAEKLNNAIEKGDDDAFWESAEEYFEALDEEYAEAYDSSIEEKNEEIEEDPLARVQKELENYEATDRIKDLAFCYDAVQIADMVFVNNGSTVADVMKMIEASAVPWEYEYNPNHIGPEDIYVKLYDKKIFTVKDYGETDSTLSTCYCPGVNIETYTNGMYIPGGYPVMGSNDIDYHETKEELQAKADELNIDFNVAGSSLSIGWSGIEPGQELAFEELGQVYTTANASYRFVFDSDTGKLQNCEYNGISYLRYFDYDDFYGDGVKIIVHGPGLTDEKINGVYICDKDVFGTWLGNYGSTITINPDGTAILVDGASLKESKGTYDIVNEDGTDDIKRGTKLCFSFDDLDFDKYFDYDLYMEFKYKTVVSVDLTSNSSGWLDEVMEKI